LNPRHKKAGIFFGGYMKKILTVILISISSAAWAGSSKELETQFNELKTTVDQQSKNVAASLNQVQEMVAQFQALGGKADQALHENELQAKTITDLQQRLDMTEEKNAQLLKQMEELKTAGLLPASQVKNLKEFQDYEKALTLLNAEDYKGGITSLQAFLKANPKSVFGEGAQYWIGEGYYLMRDYTSAISEFQKVIQKNPTGSKVSAAMLKQGYAFYEMQSFEDAKAFLGKVTQKFPGTLEAAKAQDRLVRINKVLEEKELQAVQQREHR